MAAITAAAVNDLRKKTGVSMMLCKEALTACDGDQEKAIAYIREKGIATQEKRADRETAFGRFGLYVGLDKKAGAVVELKCESAPVAGSEEFIQLANDLAQALATGPGASTVDELLAQPSPSKPGMTLKDVKDDMFNRIREVFNVGRMARFDGTCGGYSHNSGTVSGVLVEVEGGNDVAAKDVSMHIAAMRPVALSKEEIDPKLVEQEREILTNQALKEGKPANIVEKMVEGRLRNFYAEKALLEQPFVKDPAITVGQYAKQNNMTLKRFVLWELGKE
jgi:elongation factor Ts